VRIIAVRERGGGTKTITTKEGGTTEYDRIQLQQIRRIEYDENTTNSNNEGVAITNESVVRRIIAITNERVIVILRPIRQITSSNNDGSRREQECCTKTITTKEGGTTNTTYFPGKKCK
jgi:hypothetical protein